MTFGARHVTDEASLAWATRGKSGAAASDAPLSMGHMAKLMQRFGKFSPAQLGKMTAHELAAVKKMAASKEWSDPWLLAFAAVS